MTKNLVFLCDDRKYAASINLGTFRVRFSGCLAFVFGVNIAFVVYLMYILFHPLRATDDWLFKILNLSSELGNSFRIGQVSNIYILPIRECLQRPSSFKRRELEIRQEPQLRDVRGASFNFF